METVPYNSLENLVSDAKHCDEIEQQQ